MEIFNNNIIGSRKKTLDDNQDEDYEEERPQRKIRRSRYVDDYDEYDNRGRNDNTFKMIFYIIILGFIGLCIYYFIGEDGKYTEWSKCDATCGNGKQTRKYIPKTNFLRKDLDSTDDLTKDCTMPPCSENGKMSDWSNYGQCVQSETNTVPISCGQGKQQQIRTYIPAKNGGNELSSTEQKNLSQWITCTSNTPCNEASVSAWFKINGNTSNGVSTPFYYKSNGNKIYISNCYSSKTIPLNTIYYDEKRTYVPGIVPNTSMDILLDKLFINDQGIRNNIKNNLYEIRTELPITGLPTNEQLTECQELGLLENEVFTNCTPEFGTNRTKSSIRYYTDPYPYNINSHPTSITYLLSATDLARMKSLPVNGNFSTKMSGNDVIITKISEPVGTPARYSIERKNIKCDSSSNFTTADLQKKWNEEILCTTTLTDNILSSDTTYNKAINDYLYSSTLDDSSDFMKDINSWSLNSLSLSNDNLAIGKKINQCYGNVDNNNNYSLILSSGDENKLPKSYIIYPNISYSNGFKFTSKNGLFELYVKSNGQIELQSYKMGGTVLWSGNKNLNTDYAGGYLKMQSDGNLVFYFKDNTKNSNTFSSGTGTIENSGRYGELLDNGLIVIKDKSNKIIKCINLLSYSNYQQYINANDVLLSFKSGDELCFESPNIILPNIKYYDDFTWKNGNYVMLMQIDGNFVIYNATDSNNMQAIFDTQTYNPNNATGNYLKLNSNTTKLEIITSKGSNIGTVKFSANNMFNKSNTIPIFKYCKLNSNGYLVFMNTNDNASDLLGNYNNIKNIYQACRKEIIQKICSKHRDGIRDNYLFYTFWDNSPQNLFSDKDGGVWETTDNYPENVDNSYPGSNNHFRGNRVDQNHVIWNKRELSLLDIRGYKYGEPAANVTRGNPSKYPDGAWNFITDDDRKTINSEQTSRRKPKRIRDGGARPNYIPGYNRLSYCTGPNYDDCHKFLMADGGSGNMDPAFFVYTKFERNTFKNEINGSHPELVELINKEILNRFGTDNYSKITNHIASGGDGADISYPLNTLKNNIGDVNDWSDYLMSIIVHNSASEFAELNNISGFTNKKQSNNLYTYQIKKNKSQFQNKIMKSYLETISFK